MDRPTTGLETELPTAAVDTSKIDALCDRFESQLAGGNQPRIEDFIAVNANGEERAAILAELLILEVEHRRNRGESIQRSTLVERFPNDASAVDEALAYFEGRLDGAAAPRMDSSETNHPLNIGKYKIVEKLGEGGMGCVYLALDTQLQRSVAIKLPKLDGNRAALLRRRFLREARAAARLRHANICTVFEVGEWMTRPYIVMAYIKGKTLGAHFKRCDGFNAAPIVDCIRKIALALDSAHQAGVVHRDLKPANLIVEPNGEPMVMDFGLARIAADDSKITNEGEFLGTPAYMSPEQIRGEVSALGPASDIYSLGVVLYELLSGCVPFAGKSFALAEKIVNESPLPPSTHNAAIDSVLDGICIKALEKSPVARHRDMAEFANELGAWASAARSNDSARGNEARRLPIAPSHSRLSFRARDVVIGVMLAMAASGALYVGLGGLKRREPSAAAKAAREIFAVGGKIKLPNGVVLQGNPSELPDQFDGCAVDLSGRDFSLNRKALGELSSIPGIVDLLLNNNAIADDDLELLRPLGRLKSLNLSNTPITDRGLKSLAALSSLQRLYVYDTKLTGTGFVHFRNRGAKADCSLRSIVLHRTQVSAAGLEEICNLPELQELEISDVPLTDHAIQPIAQLKALRLLWLCNMRLSDDALATIAQLPMLNELNLDGCAIRGQRRGFFPRMKELQKLCMANNPMGGNLMSEFAKLPKLRTLQVDGTDVFSTDLECFRMHRSLEELALRNTKVDRSIGEFLASMPSLRIAQLGGTAIEDRTLEPLPNAAQLSSLDVSNCPLTDQAVPFLTKLKKLRRLAINGTYITAAGRRQLSESIAPDLAINFIAPENEIGADVDIVAPHRVVDTRQRGRPFDLHAVGFDAMSGRAIAGGRSGLAIAVDEPSGAFRPLLQTPDTYWAIAAIPAVGQIWIGGQANSQDASSIIRRVDSIAGNSIGEISGHLKTVSGICPLPGSNKVATASWDGSIAIWDATSCRLLARFQVGEPVSAHCASVDGKSVFFVTASGRSGNVDVRSPQNKPQLFGQTHRLQADGVVATLDGAACISASNDGTVRGWSAVTGEELFRFSGHRGCVNQVARLGNSRFVASAGEDKLVRFWSFPECKDLAVGVAHVGPIRGMWASADGKRLITVCLGGRIAFWDLTSLELDRR